MAHPAIQTIGVEMTKNARFQGVTSPSKRKAMSASKDAAMMNTPMSLSAATLSTPSRVTVTLRLRFLSSSSGCS